MHQLVDFSGKPFHFIGVGGIGMSALAYVLAKRHFLVSGSDTRLNHITQRLQQLGVHIFLQQDAGNLQFFQASEVGDSPAVGNYRASDRVSDRALQRSFVRNGATAVYSDPSALLPQVVCSTAISSTNAEFQAAVSLGCPILHRSDLLAALIERQYGIAIAGTHGKTTTSSMVGYLLLQAGLDPTIIVGGEVHAWEGNARLGESKYLVAEADESDGSLVKFAPEIGVVTNIELDHPDHYQSLAQVVETFQTFTQRCHTWVGCIDCPTVKTYLQPPITYSLATVEAEAEMQADYTVTKIHYGSQGTSAQVWERGTLLGELRLKLLGKHNLSNALAAVAIGRHLQLDFATIADALATFEGARRRFEARGYHNGILYIDDYAHHPSEVRVTLAAARLTLQSGEISLGVSELPHSVSRIVAIFQPHRYSRAITLLAEFSTAFQDADVVIVTDIYSAGEKNPGNMSGQQVADAIAQHHSQVYYQPTLTELTAFLSSFLQAGDLALFLGAGNVNQIIPALIAVDP